MKIFLDTNVLLDYLCNRAKAQDVRELLDIIEDDEHEAIMSSSSFCTLSYYVELSFKEMGIHKPEKTERTREVLKSLLEMVTVVDIPHEEICNAVNDIEFSDFEDSIQYRCAKKKGCDVLDKFPWTAFELYTLVGTDADKNCSPAQKVVLPVDLDFLSPPAHRLGVRSARPFAHNHVS